MAQDPNKIYLPDGTEAKKVDKNAAYKASRERFLAQRKKYRETPMPPADPRPTGTQAGHAVTGRNNHTRPLS